MTRTIAAAIFALLAFTAPAHAAIIQWDLSDVTAAVLQAPPPLIVTGFFDYDTTATNYLAAFPNYSFSVSGGPTLKQGGIESFTLTPSNSFIQSGGNFAFTIVNDGATDANLENLNLGTAAGFFDGTSGSPGFPSVCFTFLVK